MMSKSKRGVNEKILEYIYMEKEEFLDIYQKQPEAFEVFKQKMEQNGLTISDKQQSHPTI